MIARLRRRERELEGKVVWITGASSGIGHALALEFARQGAQVAVSARRVERLEALVDEIREAGGKALAVPCDVTDADAIEEAVSCIIERVGRLDVAVANAGISLGRRIERAPVDYWRRQFDVNVIGLAMTARHTIPHLRETAGRLVLVGSVSAFVPVPGYGAYAATKAAVNSIGMTLSVELAGSGVSCTTIHPGFVESDIVKVGRDGVVDPDMADPRPAGLVWPVDRAARRMVRAVRRRQRVLVFTGHGVLITLLGRHLPGVTHFAATTAGRFFRSQ